MYTSNSEPEKQKFIFTRRTEVRVGGVEDALLDW